MASTYPKSREHWKTALDKLPSSTKIPAFFFGHGHPGLISPQETSLFNSGFMGPRGPLANFLRDFGPAILEKYKPKAIVVFSAHWETSGKILVTNYGEDNPLLMDYFGFPPDLYKVEFKSKGDVAISNRVVELLREDGLAARLTERSEPRGEDGRGFAGPGLDHGVFIPFKLMFGDSLDIPIIQVSIDSSLKPEDNWRIGKALTRLRSEGILVLSGGLIIHTFRDPSAFAEETAKQIYKDFDKAVNDAGRVKDPNERRTALLDLVKHPGFRLSNPREEHFIPIYVAAGCGEEGEAKLLSSVYGAPTFAFGL